MEKYNYENIDFELLMKNEPELFLKVFEIALKRIKDYDLINKEQAEKFQGEENVSSNVELLESAYRQINFLNNQILDYQNWLKKSQDDLEFMKQAYHDLTNSTCWKMTAPIRTIMGGRKVNNQIKSEDETSEEKSIYQEKVKKLDLTSGMQGQIYRCRVSVVIPTYNAGKEFGDLLTILKTQKGIEEIEIVIVDSGSTDETVKIAKQEETILQEIPNSMFSHSYARNLGAEISTGEYILFMVQDAMPTDEYWLYHMLTPLLKYNLGAVSCVETPRKDVDLKYCVDMMLHNKFVGVDQGDRIMELPSVENYYTLRANAQLSDIACIFPKRVFMKYKLRGDYAEDLDIGIRLIKDGYRLALLSSVKVIHSHNRPASYGLRRAVVDISWLNKLFLDLPIERISYNDLLATIIDGYAKTCSIVEYLLTYDKSTGIKEVEKDIISYMEDIFSTPQILSTKYISNDKYSDKIIRDFLTEIEYIALASDYTKANVCYRESMLDYLKNGIFCYLYQTCDSISKKDLEGIAEAIYKRFFWEVGTKLAYYVIEAPYRDRLYDIAEELMRGI